MHHVDLVLQGLDEADAVLIMDALGIDLVAAHANFDGHIGADALPHHVDQLPGEADAVIEGIAAIFVGPLVHMGGIEGGGGVPVAEMEHHHVEGSLFAPLRRVGKGFLDAVDLLHGEVRRQTVVPQIQFDGGDGAPAVDGVGQLGEAVDHHGVRQVHHIMVLVGVGLGHGAVPHGDDARPVLGELGGEIHEFIRHQPVLRAEEGLCRGDLDAVAGPQGAYLQGLKDRAYLFHVTLPPAARRCLKVSYISISIA